MKNKLILSLLLTISMHAVADEPHIVPAANCPPGEICCPSELVCSFLEGCGNTGIWEMRFNNDMDEFDGIKHLKINKMYFLPSETMSPGQMPSTPTIACVYGPKPEFSKNDITLDYRQNNLTEAGQAWKFGFMKKTYFCASNDSSDCSAIVGAP